MRIVLNSELIETKPWREFNPEDGFYALQADIDAKIAERKKTAHVMRVPNLDGAESIQSSYLHLLTRAYSMHIPVAVAAHDLWYIVLSELAGVMKDNADACRPLFTRSADKIQIIVDSDDPVKIDLNLVEAKLADLVPIDIETFLPLLTSITPEARYACLAAFCDGVSTYYSYGMLSCGIPEIKVLGGVEDWRLLRAKAEEIGEMFNGVGLADVKTWMARVNVIFDQIIGCFEGGDTTFWKNIYSDKNVGSGGEKIIDGWIKDFYFKVDPQAMLSNFPVSWAVVPYKNLDTGREFKGVHGCFVAKRDADGFLNGSYGEFISEMSDYYWDSKTGRKVIGVKSEEIASV